VLDDCSPLGKPLYVQRVIACTEGENNSADILTKSLKGLNFLSCPTFTASPDCGEVKNFTQTCVEKEPDDFYYYLHQFEDKSLQFNDSSRT